MTDILVTSTAQHQIEALDDADAQAVDSAIQAIDRSTGELIDLPGAPAGTSYLALSTRVSRDGREGPVIVYRPQLPDEGRGWLIMSLLSPERYRALRHVERISAVDPAYRQIVAGVVGGTVSPATDVIPGTAPPTSGAVPTTTTRR
jgi:hypothetical protein